MDKGQRGNVGYTLVETMFVISIVALFAALLFPVLITAKESAYSGVAISNLHQVSLATSLYTSDVDDVIPPYFSYYDSQRHEYGSPQEYWPQLVSNYISEVRGHGYLGQALAEDLPTVFFDPIRSFKKQHGTPIDIGIISSWGINNELVHWLGFDGSPMKCLPDSLDSLGTPSGTILMIETKDWMTGLGFPGNAIAMSPIPHGYYPISAMTVANPYFASSDLPNASGKTPCLFVDGHVRLLEFMLATSNVSFWQGH